MKKRFYILLLISFLLSLADVQAQQKATPKAGEGISTFLLRHNRAPKKYYDDFVELNKAKLGKGNVLKLGVTYTCLLYTSYLYRVWFLTKINIYSDLSVHD